MRHHRWRYGVLLCTLILLSLPGTSPAQDGIDLRGRIVSADSGMPVVLARVWLAGTASGARTDDDGRFLIPDVKPGTHVLHAERLGFEELVREGIVVQPGQALELELSMSPTAMPLEEMTVTPGTFTFMDRGVAARQTMSREDIESVPQLGEDVFRAVNRLPGLASGDYAAHFSIRGGRHDETLILLDGLELYEPYHLKDFDEGAISIIDTETIDGVQLYTGGFPARYGNKRSGVFDISSRTVKEEETTYSLGLSFMNARAMARGRLGEGRGTWLASARSGFMDVVFGLIQQDELPSPRYQDFYGKVQLELNPNNDLTVSLLYAGDRYTFDAPSTTGFADSLKTREYAENHYGNSYVWTTLDTSLGSRTRVRTMLSAGLVTRNRDGSERYETRVNPIYTITNDRDFDILTVKQDWTHALADAYVLSYGIDARRLHNKDTFRSLIYQDPNDPTADSTGVYPVTTDTAVEKTGSLTSVYLSNRIRVIDPLVFELGARWDRADYTDDSDVSPRVSTALDLGGGRTLRVAWGEYRQIQGIDDVAALNNDNTYFPSELSEQWTAGIEQQFPNGALLRGEVYHKKGSHLRPVYRNWKGGVDTFPETNEDRLLVFPKSSTAKGVELYFDHRFGRRFATRASYSYTDAEEEVERIVAVNLAEPVTYDKVHPLPQHQKHAANVDLTVRFRRVWSVNGSLAYHSGWPGTLERLAQVWDENGDPDTAVRPQKIYGTRLPGYLRFDVRGTRRWKTSHGEMRFFVELVNLSNHGNVFGWDYYRELDPQGRILLVREEETWFTILPSIGVAWTGTF